MYYAEMDLKQRYEYLTKEAGLEPSQALAAVFDDAFGQLLTSFRETFSEEIKELGDQYNPKWSGFSLTLADSDILGSEDPLADILRELATEK